MTSSFEFYFRRMLPTVNIFRDVRRKLLRRSETLSASELYDRFAQNLFAYGMHVCKNRELVMEALLQLFVQINLGDVSYGAGTIQFLVFKRFRKILNQVISASVVGDSDDEYSAQIFEQCVPKAIQKLAAHKREAIFLMHTGRFNDREVAVILDVENSKVSGGSGDRLVVSSEKGEDQK